MESCETRKAFCYATPLLYLPRHTLSKGTRTMGLGPRTRRTPRNQVADTFDIWALSRLSGAGKELVQGARNWLG